MDARNSAGVSARIAVVGLVTAALLGGCDGGEGSSASSSSSSSSSAGVSGSATSSSVPSSTSSTSSSSSATAYVPVKPQFPAEAKKHTDAGAVAFVKYYWAAVDYAWTKPDADMLQNLEESTCTSCAGLQSSAEFFVQSGSRFSDPVFAVTRVEHVVTTNEVTQLACDVTQLRNTVVDKSGEPLREQARTDMQRAIEVVWRDGWRMKSIGRI